MDRPYVEELHVENYGCIKDATFKLTPLHALIGPNDSGKSTVLRALRTLSMANGIGVLHEERSRLLRAWHANTARAAVLFAVGVQGNHWKWVTAPGDPPDPFSFPPRQPEIAQALAGSVLLRLDPDALRAPNPLVPQGQPLRFLDEHGTGLAGIYDAIVTRDIPAYLQLNASLTKLFPSVASISLVNTSSAQKAMGVKLIDGTFVPAELMSEGLLYYLAFAALPYLDPTAILLIEEPENGLHPARIAEVMRVLREISKTTQVVLATHSPLVINELEPGEVTVVTRTREHGTKGVLMKDTPNFEERSKVYALGELWVSYANGEDEAPLLQGGPRS